MTNDVLKCIRSRRSIRAYDSKQINEEQLKAILEAGAYAPSAANQQSWHFTVIQNKEMMQMMSQDTKEHFKKTENPRFQRIVNDVSFNAFHNAPTAIIISGDEKSIMPQVDCALANQNMLLAAEALGLGSCWINIVIHLFSGEKGDLWKKELGIPEGYKPFYAASFGYKAEEVSALPRKENAVNFIR